MNRKRTYCLMALAAGISCCLALTAEAKKPVKPPPGPPTPPVTPGIVLINASATSNDRAWSSYIDTSGNIVFSGDTREYDTRDNVGRTVLVGRLTPDGVFDTSFGDGGIVITGVNFHADVGSCSPHYDGNIVVAGSTTKVPGTSDFLLVGYNDDGSINKYLGDVRGKRGGVVTLDFDRDSDGLGAMAVQPDDKIVVTGRSNIDGIVRLTTVRYTAFGKLDNSFGGGGIVFTEFPGFNNVPPHDVAIHGDGVVIGGEALGPEVPDSAVLARLDNSGDLDPFFGDMGQVVDVFPGYSSSRFTDLAVDVDGKIVATGIVWSQTAGTDILIARYDEFGAPDPSFGNGTGFVAFDFEGLAGNGIHAVAIQEDGKIVVTGYSHDWTIEHLVVVRVNYDGSFDTTFGGTGWVRTEILDGSAGQSVSIQDDGKIVVTGITGIDGRSVAAVVRYNSNGSLDTSFNDGP